MQTFELKWICDHWKENQEEIANDDNDDDVDKQKNQTIEKKIKIG